MRALGLHLTLVEAILLGSGIWILYDRGVSWAFILGVALLSVGANRAMRGL